MTEPYLILHKVRGEPAFDIAERIEVEGYDEPWWIIPTSGHRAYPFDTMPINEVGRNGFSITSHQLTAVVEEAAWASWPDHYQASQARSRLATAASDILSIMGLGKAKPQAPVKRRVIPNG